MSRAVETILRSCQPEALAKVVFLMPSSRAFSVILRAKRRSLPPARPSATAAATSLADLVISARIESSTEMLSPRRSPSSDGRIASAWAETAKWVSMAISPASSASKTR